MSATTPPVPDPPAARRTRSRHARALLASAAVLVTLALVAGLYLFQPWRLFTNRTVVEALPVAEASDSPSTTPTTVPATTSPSPSPPPTDPAEPSTAPPDTPQPSTVQPSTAPPSTAPPSPEPSTVELGSGALVSHEHDTTGVVRLLQLSDGSNVLRLEGLDTSDGPDLHVWLTDAPVIDGREGWFVFDDGRYTDLGPLKGNRGDQNYEIPAGTDLTALTSVSIWCQRFAVSFGAATLTPAN